MALARLPRLLGALALCSALSIALLAARVIGTGTMTYAFLAWNLFLAWVPFGLAVALMVLARPPRASRFAMGAVVLGWFLFFPNAPYLVTDLIHLSFARPDTKPKMLFDAVMLFSFAFSGLITGFLSLRIVERQVKAAWGRAAAWAVTLVTLIASGVGVTVGRFDRYNSWDVATQPFTIFAGIAHRITHDPRAMLTTALFAVFFVVSYVTVTQVAAATR